MSLGNPKLSAGNAQNWSSPAFLKRKSLPAPSVFNSLYDPFEESDEPLDEQRRKRLRFGQGIGQWRFSDRTPSPEKPDAEMVADIENSLLRGRLEGEEPQAITPERPADTPRPLSIPDVQSRRPTSEPLAIDTQTFTPDSFPSADDDEEAQIPEQPRLKPLLSAGLPLVSPLLERKARVSSYFEHDTDHGSSKESNTLALTVEESAEFIQGAGVSDMVERQHPGTLGSLLPNSLIEAPSCLADGEQPPNLALEFSESQQEGTQHAEHDTETPISHDASFSSQHSFPVEDKSLLAGETTPQEPNSTLFSDSWRLETALYKEESIRESPAVGERPTVNDVAKPELHQQVLEYSDLILADQVESGDLPEPADVPGPFHDPTEKLEVGYRSESKSYQSEGEDGEERAASDEEDEKEYIVEDDEFDSLEGEPEVEYSSESGTSDAEAQGGADRPVEVISIDSEDGDVSGVEIPQLDGSSMYAGVEIPKYRRAFSAVEGEEQENITEASRKPSEESQGELARSIATEDAGTKTRHEDSMVFNDRRLLPFTPEASGLSRAIFEDEHTQEGNIHYPLLPQITLEVQESHLLQAEYGVSQETYDSNRRDHLLTPLATQTVEPDDLNSDSVGDVETLNDSSKTLKPQYVQDILDDQVVPVPTTYTNGLIGKLRELRNSSGSFPTSSIHLQAYPDIGTWFKGSKDGEVPDTESRSTFRDEESDHEFVDPVDPANNTDGKAIREATPVQDSDQSTAQALAIAALQTSTPTGFRTPLSYFASLSTLAQYFNTTIDIFATVVSATNIDRSTKGARDYFETVYISDPSSATPDSDSAPHVTVVQIFRPYKVGLPLVQTGDVILLRNFKVQTQKHKPMLLSTESSAWAVFRPGHEVQMRGPQVEFGAEERGFAKGMIDWWNSLENEMRTSLMGSVPKTEERAKGKGKDTRGRKSIETVHELRDGTKYTDGRPGGMNDIHELRDGTVYADDES